MVRTYNNTTATSFGLGGMYDKGGGGGGPAAVQSQRDGFLGSEAEARGNVHVGLCQNCKKIYRFPDNRGRRNSMDYDELLSQKRLQESQYRSGDPFLNSGMKSSTSEGFLSRSADPTQSYDLRYGVNEFSGALSRLQNATEDNLYYDQPGMGTSHLGHLAPSDADDYYGRKSWSAPMPDPFMQQGYSAPQHQHQHQHQQQQQPQYKQYDRPPRDQKSAYRRDLQRQMEEQQSRKARENAEIKAERMGYNPAMADPMQQMRNAGGGGGGGQAYNPSVYDAGRKPRWQGGNAPPPGADAVTARQSMVQQMAMERARAEMDKKDGRDWWEKRDAVDTNAGQQQAQTRNARPHPSQTSDQRGGGQNRSTYEDDLRAQMEFKKQQQEAEKRREREEDERIERRIREQQDKLKAEMDKEQGGKKGVKKERKPPTQEEQDQKEKRMQEAIEKARKEAEEEKQRKRRPGLRRPSNEDSGRRSPAVASRRSDSPPVPSMRGGPNAAKGGKGKANVADQFSSMRNQLDRKQEEHDAVWNGLVEV